jgi:hypothetical protein
MAAFESEFHVHVLKQPMTLYRGCHGQDQCALEEAMSSNFQAGRSPHPTDLHAAVLYMAVSMFAGSATIATLARRRPDRIGTHVARVELQPGYGVCIGDTGGAGHWSIWGVPAQLVQFVTDVEKVAA